MTEPIDLAMRVKLSDDSFLRAYSNEPDEPESVFDNLKKRTGETMSRMMGFFQVRPKQELYTARVRGLIGDGRLPAQGWDLAPAGPEAVPERPSRSDDWRLYDLAPRTPEPEPSRSAAAAASAGAVFGAPRQPEPQRMPEPKPAAANLPPIPILDLGKIGQNPQRARAQAEVGGLPMVIRPQKKSVPWQWAAIIFIGCCAVVFGVLAFSGWQGGNNRVTEAVRSLFSGSELNLRVRSEDERLRLMWNPHNPAVESATDGTLQILDGTQRRKIRLEGRQIADGSVFYRPLTNDVTFRLDVHGERATASGSVRVLDGPQGRQTPVLDVSDPAPTATPVDQALNPLPPSTDPGYVDPRFPDQATIANTPVIVRRGVGGSEDVPVPVPSSAAGSYPSTGGRTPLASLPDPNTIGTSPYDTASDRAVQAPSPLNDQSTVRGSQGSLTANNRTPGYTGGSTINGWDATPEPARKRRPAATVVPPTNNVADFVAPQPLLQVTPNTKSLANGAVTATTRVEVQVRVDQTGHVAYARVLNGASVKRAVSAAALNAARQWTFQPATLRGQRVESDHTIVFEFRPQH
jgi:TonB family protein